MPARTGINVSGAGPLAATPFYRIVPVGDKEVWIIIQPLKPVPDTIPLIIGDIVHNLRSALDHLATAIGRSGGASGMNLFFPFHKERKSLVTDTAKLDPIEKALAGSKNLIIDKIQPYADGAGADLYALNTLDKTDKHNELIIATTVALSGHLIVRQSGEIALGAANIRFNPNQETTIPIGPFHGDVTVEHDYESVLEISFAQGLPFGLKPVAVTLVDLSHRVGETIEAFAALIA